MTMNVITEDQVIGPSETAVSAKDDSHIIGRGDLILITGATGFIGARVVESLLNYGFRNLRCFSRPSTDVSRVNALTARRRESARVEIVRGNLLSPEDCLAATKDVSVIIHLAAGRGEKSYPDAFMNSVITTRNLLEAAHRNGFVRRFVNVSSFTVYTNTDKPKGNVLDENCPIEPRPERRGEAYCFAKVKQDEIVKEYGSKFGIPYVIVRPGYVIGPGKQAVPGRVGIDTFGMFLHLGGSNKMPFTYVDNCADAIALVGLKTGIDGEVFNVVDDDLISSRKFLRLYKKNVRNFKSFYLPHFLSYGFCYLWESYSKWSQGQLPPAFSRSRWRAEWKRTCFSNQKLKTLVGWSPRVSMTDALQRYFEGCRNGQKHA